ncbi:MAG: PKD domain-containing protein [Thermoanaerobaculia bacterium]
MKKCLFLLLLFFSTLLQAQWIRRANIQGNITDIYYIGGQTFIVGTNGSGVFITFNNGSSWQQKIDGLPDFNVRAVCGLIITDALHPYIKVALSNGEVYYWDLANTSQTRFLLDGNWPSNSGRIIEDMAMVQDYVTNNYNTFVATDGHGILRQNGLGTNWFLYTPEILKKWKSVSAYQLKDTRGYVVLGGRKDLPQIWYIYGNSSTWTQAIINSPPSQGAITSISIHRTSFMIASAEEPGKGVYYSTNFISWAPLCSTPPNMPIYSADYVYLSGNHCIAAGTSFGVYSLVSNTSGSCVSDYTPFTNYKGKISTVSISPSNIALAGGPLKGPVSFNPCEPTSNFTYRRSSFNDYNVNFITVSPNYGEGDHTIFAASGVAGVYKNIDVIDSSSNTQRGYFYRIFSAINEDAIHPVNKVKIPPGGYLESGCISRKTIYALTNGAGLWYSPYGGRSWWNLNAGVLNGANITDMAFVSNSRFFVSAYGRDVYETTNTGGSYTGTSIPNKSVLALDNVPGTPILFAGCTNDIESPPDPPGLYKYTGEWQFINGSSNFIISRIIVDPEFNTTRNVYIGTKNRGVWVYNDNTGTFLQLNTGLPVNANILDLKISPKFADDGYMLAAAMDQYGTENKGVYFSNNRGSSWNYIGNDDIYDRVTSVEFSANFTEDSQIFAGTAHLGLFDGILGSGGVNWQRGRGFFNVPPNITGISTAPDDPKVVFASTMYDGVFKSIDGGDTFLPWGWGLEYYNGTEWCPVPNTLSVAVTDNIPSIGKKRVVIGTKGQGIFYGNFDISNPGWDSVAPSNKTSGIINEIRYLNSTEDMRATDTTSGDWASANFGQNWYQVTGAIYGLTDISYGSGLTRGLTNFVWGCSSGKSVSLRSGVCNYQGAAWYRPPFGTWTQCSTEGLDTCEDFRSILQIGSSSILFGSIDIGGSGNWVGLYRSDDSCSSFKPSAEGLPQNPKVYALYQNIGTDNFVLAAVEDSYLADSDQGGIYYSDATSLGRAWVITNLPSATPSSWEVSSTSTGTTIYAGLSSDGIFSSLPSSIPISVPPTAYFEVQSEACVNTPVQFNEYSAGRVTSWYWTFGDGGESYERNPVHTYISSGTYYPRLTATNTKGSDSYPNSLYDVSIVVRDEMDVGNTLRVYKTGNPNEIQITWNDLTEETGYRVYASNVASNYQTSFPDLPPNTTSYTTTTSYTYFRVQPLSTNHICGDGIIGGSW